MKSYRILKAKKYLLLHVVSVFPIEIPCHKVFLFFSERIYDKLLRRGSKAPNERVANCIPLLATFVCYCSSDKLLTA